MNLAVVKYLLLENECVHTGVMRRSGVISHFCIISKANHAKNAILIPSKMCSLWQNTNVFECADAFELFISFVWAALADDAEPRRNPHQRQAAELATLQAHLSDVNNNLEERLKISLLLKREAPTNKFGDVLRFFSWRIQTDYSSIILHISL